MWGSLLSWLLAEEQEALAGVCCPSYVLVGGILNFLAAKVAGESLGLDRLSTEPEKLLLENEAPIESYKSAGDPIRLSLVKTTCLCSVATKVIVSGMTTRLV